MRFAWSNKLSVGNKDIDKQHMELIALTISFQEACAEGNGSEIEKKVLGQLIKYARFHFSSEEKYMKEMNYSGLIQHKVEHQSFVDHITDLYERSCYRDENLNMELLQYMKNWIMSHISESDRKIVLEK